MDIVFDIGKVLLDFDFESSLLRLIPPQEPDPRARLAKVLGDKDAFERGDIDLENYLAHAERELGPAADREAFMAAWRNIFTPNEPMWESARRLHADGHRLLYFSNINPIHAPWIFEQYAIFDLFSDGLCSYLVRAIKPEPEIYQILIDRFSLVPSNTIYIDDLPANAATGESFGFHTHLYNLHQHPTFETWLTSVISK
ncbi:MAG: HAD family phosphatase [Akkermansiaceae bacterium]|jgi:putative hydrolase of the HAD superfamily|nr:HAD family phosphatase [Akkermansiaceae bacterium]